MTPADRKAHDGWWVHQSSLVGHPDVSLEPFTAGIAYERKRAAEVARNCVCPEDMGCPDDIAAEIEKGEE